MAFDYSKNRFIVEVEDVYVRSYTIEKPQGAPEQLYRIKGFSSLVFDEKGLERLQTESQGILKGLYDAGYSDAMNDAKQMLLSAFESMGVDISPVLDKLDLAKAEIIDSEKGEVDTEYVPTDPEVFNAFYGDLFGPTE